MLFDLSNNPLKSDNPKLCQIVMRGSLKITGINQFHNHITGNEIKTEKMKTIIIATTVTPITLKTLSINLLITLIYRLLS